MSCRWAQRLGVRKIPGPTQAIGSPPGAARYLLVELEAYKAAPLQAGQAIPRAPTPKRPNAERQTPNAGRNYLGVISKSKYFFSNA
jgi:hypothetical protein